MLFFLFKFLANTSLNISIPPAYPTYLEQVDALHGRIFPAGRPIPDEQFNVD